MQTALAEGKKEISLFGQSDESQKATIEDRITPIVDDIVAQTIKSVGCYGHFISMFKSLNFFIILLLYLLSFLLVAFLIIKIFLSLIQFR